jgi:hypothetical protein
MITLQDIDVALARAEQLVRLDLTEAERDEAQTCLTNARFMLRQLGREAGETLERMSDTLDALRDISQGR